MAIPPDIRIRLEQLRGEMAAKAEAQRRQQQALDNAEKMSKQFVPGKAKGGVLPKDQHDENLKRFLAESAIKQRMYTGTSKDKDFSKFNVPRNGAWFTPSTEVASSYAKENDSKDLKYDFDTRRYKEVNTADRVMPVYLRATKPYQITADDIKSMRSDNYKKAQSKFFDTLRAKGHDSVVYEDGTTVILEGPHQIKSAIGNRGTYDPSNPDITKANGGEVNTPNLDTMRLALTQKNRRPHFASGGSAEDDYRSEHTAPSPEFGAPMHDVTRDMYPKDFYGPSGFRIYADYGEQKDRDAYNKVTRVKGKPDEMVFIHRAIPTKVYNEALKKDSPLKHMIRPGDWVAIHKDYAKEHGESVLLGDYKIASMRVPAKHVWTNGDSIHEWGYHPVDSKAEGGKVQPSVAQMKLALNQQGMYSPLEKAAMSIPRTKGTPAEFMAEISKQPGFRKDEVEDRKISLPEGKMTKQEFLEHVQKNHPSPRLDEQIYHSEDEDEGDQTKYGDYQLPGGQNYREVLLKTPQQGLNDKERDRKMWLEANQRRGSLTIPEDNELMKLQIKEKRGSQDYQSSHWMDERNVLAHMRLSDRYVGDTGNFAVMGTKGGKTRWLFTTGINGTPEQAQQAAKKWEDQGYETSINQVGGGKKLLHIEEIQSDWHQEGRKKGYANPQAREQLLEQIESAKQAHQDYLNQMKEKYGGDGLQYARNMTQEEKEEARRLAGESERIRQSAPVFSNQVPDAPFKKNWHELALKHALGIAAKGGYDGIVITPGEQQADRYDLSKHVDQLMYQKNPDGTYKLSAQAGGRGHMIGDSLKEDELEQHVGKEVAQKIAKGHGEEQNLGGSSISQPPNVWKTMSGLDLKVGGEGMKGFYDKIVPTYLNKLGKPHGAQVQMNGISVSAPSEKSWGIEDAANFHGMTGAEYLDHPDRPQLEKQFLQARQNQKADLHYFPITDSMRQQIKTEGLPQYEQGGKVKGLDHFFESDNSLDHFFQE